MRRTIMDRWPDGPATAGGVIAFGVMLAFAPDQFLPMLLRAFLWQWTFAFLVLLIAAACWRKWWTASAATCSAILVLFPSCPVGKTAAAGIAEAPLLRLAQMNVYQPNPRHAEVIEAARATHAEVISFQEVDADWAADLVKGLEGEYPYHCVVPNDHCYGMALFSRRPLEQVRVVRGAGKPMIEALLNTDAGAIRLLAVHATSPGSYGEFRDRNQQLEHLAGIVESSRMPVVIMGDLNTVSWDGALRTLCARARLHESDDAPCATWPSFAGLAMIPLDHILLPPSLTATDLHTFTIPGSDHRGLTAGLYAR